MRYKTDMKKLNKLFVTNIIYMLKGHGSLSNPGGLWQGFKQIDNRRRHGPCCKIVTFQKPSKLKNI